MPDTFAGPNLSFGVPIENEGELSAADKLSLRSEFFRNLHSTLSLDCKPAYRELRKFIVHIERLTCLIAGVVSHPSDTLPSKEREALNKILEQIVKIRNLDADGDLDAQVHLLDKQYDNYQSTFKVQRSLLKRLVRDSRNGTESADDLKRLLKLVKESGGAHVQQREQTHGAALGLIFHYYMELVGDEATKKGFTSFACKILHQMALIGSGDTALFKNRRSVSDAARAYFG